MAKQILIMRGPEDRLPSKLAEGELAFCLDSKKLFIGGSAENVLLADGNGGGDSSAAYVYKCTGTDDNLVICQIVESFLSTNDGVQNLKLYIEGVAGVTTPISSSGFYVNSTNPYGKSVALDFANCTLPDIGFETYFCTGEHVSLENAKCSIEATRPRGDGISIDHTFHVFNKCANLFNCEAVINIKVNGLGNGYAVFTISGFNKCTNLTGCTSGGSYGNGPATVEYRVQGFNSCDFLKMCSANFGVIASISDDSYVYGFKNCTELNGCIGEGGGNIEGCGFGSCKNLINCTGTARGQYSRSCGFFECAGLLNCTGFAESVGISGSANPSGFHDCKRLVNCKGYGYRIFTNSNIKSCAFHWTGSTAQVAQMINCTAPLKAISNFVQDYGILLNGTTSGARYCLIGNTIASDSGGFVGIKKHSVTGSEYTETGTIRASVE